MNNPVLDILFRLLGYRRIILTKDGEVQAWNSMIYGENKDYLTRIFGQPVSHLSKFVSDKKIIFAHGNSKKNWVSFLSYDIICKWFYTKPAMEYSNLISVDGTSWLLLNPKRIEDSYDCSVLYTVCAINNTHVCYGCIRYTNTLSAVYGINTLPKEYQNHMSDFVCESYFECDTVLHIPSKHGWMNLEIEPTRVVYANDTIQ